MSNILQDVDLNVVHPLSLLPSVSQPPSLSTYPVTSNICDPPASATPHLEDQLLTKELKDTCLNSESDSFLPIHNPCIKNSECEQNTGKEKDNLKAAIIHDLPYCGSDQNIHDCSLVEKKVNEVNRSAKSDLSNKETDIVISSKNGILSDSDCSACETTFTMGNKQTNVKTAREEEEVPDDGKTKCCNVPKKKVKDKSKRISRASRSDDLGFDEDEVYPFDGRTRSDSELNDPVELEPFDIVETDDIRFVPGAGTSDVIKSASEPKFTPIPEEDLSNDTSGQRIVEGAERTDAKMFFFPSGNPIAEPGTATALSTFEFKHVKSKGKPAIPTTDPIIEPLYENIVETPKSSNTPSTCAEEPLSSSTSSKSVSRQNSKEPIQKPLRKSKKGKTTTDQDTEVKSILEEQRSTRVNEDETTQVKTKVKKSDQPSIRDSEIDRNIDSVLMLTQTMFSKLKKPDAQITMPPEHIQIQDNPEEAIEGKYENVNVCVKLEPTGLAIAHKETKQMNDDKRRSKSSSSVKSTTGSDKVSVNELNVPGKYENVDRCAKLERAGISIGHKGDKPSTISILPDKDKKKSKQSGKGSKDDDKKKRRKASDDKEYVSISRHNSNVSESLAPGILHISDSGTLIIKEKLIGKTENKDNEQGRAEAAIDDAIGITGDQKQQRGMLHISDSGTLVIQSLPKPPTHAPSTERGGSHYYENDIIDRDSTDIKVPFEEIDNVFTSEEGSMSVAPRREQRGSGKKEETRDSESSVPPSSPSVMDMLAEVLEEEEEEEDYDDANDAFEVELDKRQSAEMVEFTESVCKRLSQLLEVENKDEDGNENEDYLFESGTFGNYENIYETLNKESEASFLRNEQLCAHSASLDSGVTSKGNLEGSHGAKSSSVMKSDSLDSDVFDSSSKLNSVSSDDDDMPEYFDPRKSDTSTLEPSSGNFESKYFSNNDSFRSDRTIYTEGTDSPHYEYIDANGRISRQLTLPLRPIDSHGGPDTRRQAEDVRDKTPTVETVGNMFVHTDTATAQSHTPVHSEATSGRRSATCTESDLDISEHRDDLSTDSMLADDEEEETMEILFTKTYTEPKEGAEVFLSCTVVNSAYKEENKKSETWLSDEALEYFEANASEVMSTAFIKAKREMKDIQACLQSLRKQMEHFHGDRDDISLPDIPVETLSPDYFGYPRKAITD